MFGKKRDRLGHAGHIKSNTVGTSNEISFSVLDAAKQSMDGSSKEPSEAFKGFGKIALFTLPGKRKNTATPVKEQQLILSGGEPISSIPAEEPSTAAFSVDLTPGVGGSPATAPTQPAAVPMPAAAASPRTDVQAEIKRRKARRKRRRALAIIAGCLVVAALAVLVGITYQQFYEKHQSVTSELGNALTKIQKADEALVRMDQVLANPIDAASFENIDALFADLKEADKGLSEADTIVKRILSVTESTTDGDTANYVSAAIAARKEMLTTGTALLERAYEAQEALNAVSSASDQIYVADSLARDAARLVSGELTEEHLLSSYEKTRAAIDELTSAREKLSRANEAFPTAGIGLFIDYVDLRIEAFEHGLASTQALMDEDTELAIQENDAYTEADGRAATLASQFPENWLEPIRAAFDEEVASQIADYEQARTNAGVTDSFLRNYLGKEAK